MCSKSLIYRLTLLRVFRFKVLPRETLPCRLAQLGHDVYNLSNGHTDLLPFIPLSQGHSILLDPITRRREVHCHSEGHTKLICSSIPLSNRYTCTSSSLAPFPNKLGPGRENTIDQYNISELIHTDNQFQKHMPLYSKRSVPVVSIRLETPARRRSREIAFATSFSSSFCIKGNTVTLMGAIIGANRKTVFCSSSDRV